MSFCSSLSLCIHVSCFFAEAFNEVFHAHLSSLVLSDFFHNLIVAQLLKLCCILFDDNRQHSSLLRSIHTSFANHHYILHSFLNQFLKKKSIKILVSCFSFLYNGVFVRFLFVRPSFHSFLFVGVSPLTPTHCVASVGSAREKVYSLRKLAFVMCFLSVAYKIK